MSRHYRAPGRAIRPLAIGLMAAACAPAAQAAPLPGFAESLVAPGPDRSVAAGARVYDRLIGDWDVEFHDFLDGGRVVTTHGTWRFAWILEGLLIEDVIVVPPDAGPPDLPRRIGITVRAWDAQLGAWRVAFLTPGTGVRNELIARRVGDDIVQTGTEKGVRPIRWSFVDFGPDSCTWRGESLDDDGKTWKLEAEFHLRRRKAGA